MIVQEADYLAHVGVLGMKWGHRKSSIYLNKGTTVHHISKQQTFDLSNKRIYASYKVKDLQRYQYVAGKMWTTKKLYDHSYSLNEKLRIPSKKEQNNIYDELSKKHKDIKKTIEKFMGDKINTDMETAYGELMGYKNLPFMDKYKSIAKKRGYNAIVDYNDKGRNAENPIIILDAKKVFQKYR